MKPEWKKRLATYLVLVAVVVGVLYFLKTSPVDVRVEVDLTGVRLLAGGQLSEVKMSVFTADGTWVSSTVHAFPTTLYPSGPPASAPPVEMKFNPGQYDVRLDYKYSSGRSSHKLIRVQIEEPGTLELKGAPAG